MWMLSLGRRPNVGLPQTMMLLLFSGALLALTRAISARLADPPGRALGWLALVGLLLGLVTLAHGLGVWLFAGALGFVARWFRPRRLRAALALAVPFALVVLPWLARNYSLTGNPLGLAGYALLDGVGGSTATRMRGLDPLTAGVSPLYFRAKLMGGIVAQLGTGLGRTAGGGFLAGLFFLALLHPFRRPEAAALRWALVAMWAAAVVGMALLGWEASTLAPPMPSRPVVAPKSTTRLPTPAARALMTASTGSTPRHRAFSRGLPW